MALTLVIRPGDSVTLKERLEEYVLRTNGSRMFNSKRKECCKDPNFVFNMCFAKLLRGKTVTIISTSIKARFDKDGQIIGSFYYLLVEDKIGNHLEIPVEFINQTHCLRRSNRRIPLHHKNLICENL